MRVLLVLVVVASPLIAVAETKHDSICHRAVETTEAGSPDCDRVATASVERPARPASPPISGGRFIGQIAIGYLGGAVGLAGTFAIWWTTCAWGSSSRGCGAAFAVAGVASTTLLLSLGVYSVGRSRETTSSFGATLVGSVVGGAVGILTTAALSRHQPGLAAIAFIGAPMAGALVGFYARHRWRETLAVGALVHVERGKVSLGVPMVGHGETDGATVSLVPLLGGAF